MTTKQNDIVNALSYIQDQAQSAETDLMATWEAIHTWSEATWHLLARAGVRAVRVPALDLGTTPPQRADLVIGVDRLGEPATLQLRYVPDGEKGDKINLNLFDCHDPGPWRQWSEDGANSYWGGQRLSWDDVRRLAECMPQVLANVADALSDAAKRAQTAKAQVDKALAFPQASQESK